MNFQFIFTVFAFAAFLLGISYAIYSYVRLRFSRERLRLERRLDAITAENAKLKSNPSDSLPFSTIPKLDAWMKRYSTFVWLYESIQRLKWSIHTDQFIFLVAGLFFITDWVLIKLGASFLLSSLFSFSVASSPFIYLMVSLSERQTKLERQLPEILDFIARAMQAGHTFVSSLQMAANDSQEPIASEFQKTFQEISFGRSVQDSMSDLSRQIDCAEMRYFAVAVFVNQEIDGNLASLIKGVAKLIRERLRTKMLLHAMTGEARASAWILSVLPFVVALIMFVVRSDFIVLLWSEPAGRTMVGYSLLLMFSGIFWMQRMAKIRV